MSSRALPLRLLATAGVAAALLAGAAALHAASGGRGVGPLRLSASASGSISLTNSRDGEAIFRLVDLGPGAKGEGEVTISNDGSEPGALELTAVDPSETAGFYGGRLSSRLELVIDDLTESSRVYRGALGEMPPLQLGQLAPDQARTYRFTVTMVDGGAPASPYVDDNLYQRASASLGYEWTLTEVEPGSPEAPRAEERPEPAAPAPPSPPAPPRVGRTLVGTPHRDRLIGTDGSDRISGLGGNDLIVGAGGSDYLSGGPGADRLRGGGGHDHLEGGSGPDVISAADGEADTIDCGAGSDTAYVDQRDAVRGCERVRRR